MKTFPLRIRPTAEPQRAVAAWLLIEPRAAGWLDELAGWGLPLDEWTLYVVPVGPHDLAPKGVLCIPPSGAKPTPSRRAIPLGVEAGRLYAPIDARFDPPITAEELEQHLVGRVSLLAPPDELIAFDAEDALSPAALLTAPAERWTNWTRAVPGEPRFPRLERVEPLHPPTIATLLSGDGDGIGSQPLTQAPPTPDEQAAGPISKLGTAMGQGMAAGLGAIISGLQNVAKAIGPKGQGDQGGSASSDKAPTPASGGGSAAGAGSGAGGAGLLGSMQQWLSSAQQALAASAYSAQRRELQRLLHLLQTNPDEGLRYALPQARDAMRAMGGAGGPNSRLTERSVDFNLGRLFGSGAGGNVWFGFDDIQRQLEDHYRRLAEREIQLGRHRRAAYIYAELLADLRSAAEVLVAGKHYREAAVLYRDRLQAPRQAAECLEQGGLLIEAIEIYEQLRDHLKVGDLYTQLDRIPEARRAFKEAIDARRSAKDFLTAAEIHLSRLQEPDQALALLALAWPWSEQAALCLRRRFALLGELGRTEETQRLVTRLRDECTDRRVGVLAAELATVVETYPDRQVRESAADAARVVVGGRLPHVSDEETRTLTAVLARLAPEDRLLRRDGDRWADRRAAERLAKREGLAPGASATRGSQRGRIKSLGFFHLPEQVEWRVFEGTDVGYWAAGYSPGDRLTPGGLIVAAGRWADVVLSPPGAERDDETKSLQGLSIAMTATCVSAMWSDFPKPLRNYPFLLKPDFPDDHSTLLMLLGGPSVPRLLLPLPSRGAARATYTVGSATIQPDGVLGAAVGDLRTLWALIAHDQTTLLNVYGDGGKLLRSRDLRLPSDVYFRFPTNRVYRPIPMVVRGGAALLAAGRYLLRGGPLNEKEVLPTHSCELPSNIHDLAAPNWPGAVGLAAGLERGAAYFPDALTQFNEWQDVGSEIANPLVAFTRSGLLIVVGPGALEVYERPEGRDSMRLLDGAAGEGRQPLGATATDYLNRFAVASEDGVVRLYEVADRE